MWAGACDMQLQLRVQYLHRTLESERALGEQFSERFVNSELYQSAKGVAAAAEHEDAGAQTASRAWIVNGNASASTPAWDRRLAK